ncbi:FitA-like ribbon-helix-helix domain-containing protein [Nesterenkonia ebinurensis]|uniref:FitA-like ribbon-helix-helix domain-containing protein n=1 Tax=Nesterenkonia ebinurensis TaxID=2608252 RepID=UPI00123CA7C1|nr:plasmid stabilization protein [Nesterenkonia ebinurensis]
MADMLIRGIDDDAKERIRVRAAQKGHSMEAEAREILERSVTGERPKYGLGTTIHQRFLAAGSPEFEVPPRDGSPARAVDFGEMT